MSKVRQILFPAMAGRSTGIEIKVGEETIRFDIPAGGLPVEDAKHLEALKAHKLNGHIHGFIIKDPASLKGEKRDTVFTGEPAFVDQRPKPEASAKIEIVDAEDAEEDEEVTAEETEDANGDGVITVEDVTNINQAKDYLTDKFEDLDGRKINTKAKILAAAKDSGIEFPNLK